MVRSPSLLIRAPTPEAVQLLFLLSLPGVSGFLLPAHLEACSPSPPAFPQLLTAPESEQKSLLLAYLKCAPADPRGYNTLGTIYLKEGRYELARKLFARARELRPQEPRYAYNLCVALFREGRYLEALKGFAELYRAHPRYVRARFEPARARGAVEEEYRKTGHPLLRLILERWEELKERYEKERIEE